MPVRPALLIAVAAAGLSAGFVALLHAKQELPATPPTELPSLEDRVLKLERLANQPPLPPDPTAAAHAASTQPDVAAAINAPADVKQALQQLDARLDTVERRLTLLENQSRAAATGDDSGKQLSQITRLLEDQARDTKDLANRVHHLEQHN